MYAASYVWARILRQLEQQLTDVMVSTWFDDAEVLELTDERLVIYSPNDFRQETIRLRYAAYIEAALKELFHSSAKLEVWGDAQRSAHSRASAPFFSPRFTFDTFIAGASNQLPLKIALTVAENPGQHTYNPVFFYGDPGVGKTHLLYAIANDVSRRYPDKKVVCTKGDQFTNELIHSIRSGSTADFKQKFRHADVLLVDDIQFIAGKEATQEEFFHTFDYLYEHGSQIILTADRKPTDMATLEDRLRSRFGEGVMVGIQPPDHPTRIRITRAKAEAMGLACSNEIIDYIAANFSDNVRQIEGALKKIRAYRDLTGMELTLPNIRHTVEDLRSDGVKAQVTPELIVRTVCRYYGIEEALLQSPQRSRNISTPRQITMYLLRHLTTASYDQIAKLFCRDRATVIHGVRQVEKELQLKDSRIDSVLQDLKDTIDACL